MLKHDQQRFQVFANLGESVDEADFFARLKAGYDDVGIGRELDFAAIPAAWARGVALPLEWRKELATQTPFSQRSYGGDGTYEAMDAVHRKLFVGTPDASWIARGEWLVVLLAPLLEFYPLASVFLPRDHRANPVRYKKANATLGAGLREWAAQVGKGTGEWGETSSWLRSAGAEPGSLAAALAPGKGALEIYQIDGLRALRLQLLLVREQLLLGTLSNDFSVDLLLCCMKVLVDSSNAAKELDVPLGGLHQFSLPLLKELVGSPRWEKMLAAPNTYGYDIVGRLLGDYALGALFAASADGFRAFLAGLSETALRWTKATESFADRYPEAALILEQTHHQRLGEFTPRSTSPAALTWYQSLLESLSGRLFRDVLDQFKRSGDEAQLHQVITRYLSPRDEEQDFSWQLLEQFANAEYLYSYLSSSNQTLQARAAEQLFKVATIRLVSEKQNDERADAYAKHPQNWPLLMRASAAFPALFIELLDVEIQRDDLERWELLWDLASAEQKVKIAGTCLQTLGVKYIRSQLIALMERLNEQDCAPFHAYINGDSGWSADEQIGALAKQKTPLLQWAPRMAARALVANKDWARNRALDPKSASAIAAQTLVDYPQAFAALDEKARIKLLQLFDDSSLVACGDGLAKLFNSSSKTLREPVLSLLTRSSAAAIQASGLLEASPKARRWVLTGMALAEDPAMVELINRHFNDEAHDDYSRGLSLNVLERAGLAVGSLDTLADADLATLQKEAAGVKIPAAVSKHWSEEFATVLAPLGETLGRHLLFLLYDGGQQIPRHVRQILDFLPAGRRSDLAFLSVQRWIAANGAAELDWMLLTVPEFGDERVANALVKAVNDWKKLRKVKANAALHLLCQLPGDYGVFQARDLWENGKLSDAVLIAARQALTEAATRRDMILSELLEQLVPDFGLTHEGLQLDVGPYQYVVRMHADLSLVVIDENGKTSKTLPKAKAGEDADKRSLAENHFKALSKNLKPVFKQQSRRLARLFQLGSAWPAATWQKLFIQHPLMAVIAQTVVWSANDGQGQPLQRFRPVGGELIDLNDDPYSLPANAIVHATHPLELEESELAAWVAHFKDYQLESPIEQWTTPVLVPPADVMAADRLALPARKKLNRGKLGNLLEKWGYSRGQAGSGGRINEHTWLLDGGRWRVTLNHGAIGVYFDAEAKVGLQDIQVHRREGEGFAPQRLGELPPAFLNTLLHQAQTLEAHAL
ncbi:DUF4132 domain-containing protein [Pseudomonas turukhanskensis]|uniref:DUF4132 domain-containing protein n=1 Tax=Pseudomonas turukhanskensis TaxID=1806536 RepID=A0A9W6K533_9PSED|nr:DUF4132 domain-containing protein [Pseudomonas turukhanskensis]GLK89626.1 hypothetical protein GCM10017655_26880 [Pseudomonas turukhanskensis]